MKINSNEISKYQAVRNYLRKYIIKYQKSVI